MVTKIDDIDFLIDAVIDRLTDMTDAQLDKLLYSADVEMWEREIQNDPSLGN